MKDAKSVEVLNKKKQFSIYIMANYFSNAGKTTLTKNMLVPRLPGAEVFAFEVLNTGYDEDEKTYSAEETRALLPKIMAARLTRDVIIDIGTSECRMVFRELESYKKFLSLVTAFIIPVTDDTKSINETLNTVGDIIENLDFDPKKIFVILNRISAYNMDKTSSFFERIAVDAKNKGYNFVDIPIQSDASVSVARKRGETIHSFSEIDYSSKIETGSEEICEMWIAQMTAASTNEQMGNVFDRIVKG
jgi:hypothetical protein